MTPTRWLIAAFWVFVIVMCGKSFYDYNHRLDYAEGLQAEKHYYAPPLPGSVVPVQSTDADVRQVSYSIKENALVAQIQANLVIKNFGQKKATNIQVRVQPYTTSVDSSSQIGPDEILNASTVDTMANYYQWVEFPDLGPGESATNDLTFPVRPDAVAREHFDPKINFETARSNP